MNAFLIGLGVALACEILVWIASLARRDASLADLAWAPIFVMIAAAVHADMLTFVLVDLWAARLAIHLAWRARGKGEDRRYAAMRAHHGARFWWVFSRPISICWSGRARNGSTGPRSCQLDSSMTGCTPSGEERLDSHQKPVIFEGDRGSCGRGALELLEGLRALVLAELAGQLGERARRPTLAPGNS